MSSASIPKPALAATYQASREVIFFFDEFQSLVVHHILAHTHVEINEDLFRLLQKAQEPKTLAEFEQLSVSKSLDLKARDVTCFSNARGLLSDPSNLICSTDERNQLPWLTDFESISKLLIKRKILIDTQSNYHQFWQAKENIFDNHHAGNFHQQLGHQLRVVERTDPDAWWVDQKYLPGTDELQNNLYRHIQLYFYDRFFTRNKIEGKKVLDVGCGTGFYSRYLAKQGGDVTGIDPNPKHIEKAKKFTPSNFKAAFSTVDIASGTALESLTSNSFDWILFQDALMFYFVPYGNKPLTTRTKVLTELKRALKPNGRMIVMEPHGVFWLAPWMGRPEHPFTILTEYSKKSFGVTPTLSQISAAFEEAGLFIRQIHEPEVSPEAMKVNPKAFAISQQFPQWWVFELIKCEGL